MSRRCELSGKAVLVGNNVSHANNKSKRRFLPNINRTTFHSEVLSLNVRLNVTSHAIRSVEHNGGLDGFLAKAKADVLSPRALKIKREIEKKQRENEIEVAN